MFQRVVNIPLVARFVLATLFVLSNMWSDVIYAQTNGNVTLVSISSNGVPANEPSGQPTISDNGRFIVFSSLASNLTENDTNQNPVLNWADEWVNNDVFRHDLETQTTTLVSVSLSGKAGNSGSAGFGEPSVSSDGRFIVFQSEASDLVEGDTNGKRDLFIRDMLEGETKIIPQPSINYLYPLTTNNAKISANYPYPLTTNNAKISADGNFVVFELLNENEIYRYSLQTQEHELVSVISSQHYPSNSYAWFPSISNDGRYIAFAVNTFNIYLRDMNEEDAELVTVTIDSSQPNGMSWLPSVSGDGRLVAFYSKATNLVESDTNNMGDVFVRDMHSGSTTLISVSSDGSQGTSVSLFPEISGDGRYVVFNSEATRLVDSYYGPNIYVHDLLTKETSIVSVSEVNSNRGTYANTGASISSDGKFVTFISFNLTEQTTKGGAVYVRNMSGASSGSSGFDPGKDGYQFENDEATASWNTFIQTFDFPDRLFYRYSLLDKYMFDSLYMPGVNASSVCGGMSATSSLFFSGDLNIPDSLGSSTHDIASPVIENDVWLPSQINDLLVIYQGRQLSKEWQAMHSVAARRTAQQTAELIKQGIDNHEANYVGFRGSVADMLRCLPHAVVPTGWESDGDEIKITVYDPNRVGQLIDMITINSVTGKWSIDMGNRFGVIQSDNSCLLNYNMLSSELYIIPSTVLRDGRTPLWANRSVQRSATGDDFGYISLAGTSQAIVTGGNAEQIVYPSVLPDGTVGQQSLYTYAAGQTVTVTMQYSRTEATVNLISAGQVMAMKGSANLGSTDTLIFDANNSGLVLESGSNGIREVSSISQESQLSLANVLVQSGTVVTTTFGGQTVTVSASSEQQAYTLNLENLTATGSVGYTMTMPILEAGGTHVLVPSMTEQLVTVNVDGDSDGVTDEVITVKPGEPAPDPRIYLPLIQR